MALINLRYEKIDWGIAILSFDKLLFIAENTHFLSGSITVLLTSCLNGLDLTKQVNMFLMQHKQISCKQFKQKVSRTVILPLLEYMRILYSWAWYSSILDLYYR